MCYSSVPHSTSALETQSTTRTPMENLHADFKGPIGEKYYLQVVIDQYSKYPEVDIVSSTSFRKLEPCLDRIMVTHGIPEQLTTDNSSPYFSDEMAQYAKRMGFKHHPVTPKDPQSNGFAKSFIKLLCKLVHTAIAERKDPKRELHNYLLQYRATPHTTLGNHQQRYCSEGKYEPNSLSTTQSHIQRNRRACVLTTTTRSCYRKRGLTNDIKLNLNQFMLVIRFCSNRKKVPPNHPSTPSLQCHQSQRESNNTTKTGPSTGSGQELHQSSATKTPTPSSFMAKTCYSYHCQI